MTKQTSSVSKVELRAAKIPHIGLIAAHYWFVIYRAGETQRWEVWQKAQQNTTSWGYIHNNLLPITQGVGNGDSWLETQWQGQQAMQLAALIEQSPLNYPNKQRYCYWPGPNSNTYVQWLLNQAQISYQLRPQGIGKNHLGWIGWRNTHNICQFSTPLFGFIVVKAISLEWHLLHLAISVQIKPFKLRTFFYY